MKSTPVGTHFPPISHSNSRPNNDRELHRSTKGKPVILRRRRRNEAPVTPLKGWKYFNGGREFCGTGQGGFRRATGESVSSVSARKLAAGMWKLVLPVTSGGGGLKDRFSLQNPKFQVEGPATKWESSGYAKISTKSSHLFKDVEILKNKEIVASVPVISVLQAKLDKARSRISELETQRRFSKKEIIRCLKKLGEERNERMRRERDKLQSVIDDLNLALKREKQNSRTVRIVNSKLVRDLINAKLSTKKFMRGYERERKTRELMEEVCEELAVKIEDDKIEIEELERESTRISEEVEEERKMLQIAEVWREERLQMKLVDAKLVLEEKYRQMNNLVADLEAFVTSRDETDLDMIEISEADVIRQAVNSVDVHNIKEFSCVPRESDIMYKTIEDLHNGSPALEITKKSGQKDSMNGYSDQGWTSYNPDEVCTSIEAGSSCTGLPFLDVGGESLKSEINEICARLKKQLVPCVMPMLRS